MDSVIVRDGRTKTENLHPGELRKRKQHGGGDKLDLLLSLLRRCGSYGFWLRFRLTHFALASLTATATR
jgi:hypothetical protein